MLKFKWKLLGIYFDDPSKLVDPSDFRFILGMQVTDTLSETQVANILEGDKNLRHVKEIPDTTCLTAVFPYKNNFTYFFSSANTYG